MTVRSADVALLTVLMAGGGIIGEIGIRGAGSYVVNVDDLRAIGDTRVYFDGDREIGCSGSGNIRIEATDISRTTYCGRGAGPTCRRNNREERSVGGNRLGEDGVHGIGKTIIDDALRIGERAASGNDGGCAGIGDG